MDIWNCQETIALIALTSLPLIASNLGSEDDSVTLIKSFLIKVLGNVIIMYNIKFAVHWHSGAGSSTFPSYFLHHFRGICYYLVNHHNSLCSHSVTSRWSSLHLITFKCVKKKKKKLHYMKYHNTLELIGETYDE